MDAKLERFRALVEEHQRARYLRDYPSLKGLPVYLHTGRKFARIDVDTSGKYMVDLGTGEIFGIKSYGVVHRGHRYGTLDTIDSYYWGDYQATIAKAEGGVE